MKKEDAILIGCIIAFFIVAIFDYVLNNTVQNAILLLVGELSFWIAFKLTKDESL